MGKRPIVFELTITAGRILRISDPIVGSRLTSQTSPRLGVALILNNISRCELAPAQVLLVMVYYIRCLHR